MLFRSIGYTAVESPMLVGSGSNTYSKKLSAGATVYLTGYNLSKPTTSASHIYNGKMLRISTKNLRDVAMNPLPSQNSLAKVIGVAVAKDSQGQFTSYFARKTPSYDSGFNAFGSYAEGDVVEIIDSDYNNEWMQIKYPGDYIGYMPKRYIDMSTFLPIGEDDNSHLYPNEDLIALLDANVTGLKINSVDEEDFVSVTISDPAA